MSFYLEIAKQTDGSLEVRRDVALATYEVASIRAQFSQLDEALELFNKSLRLAEEVVSENPRDVEIRRLQIDSMTGKTYVSRENAEEILHEACKLSDELVKDFPDDASSYGVKATIWNNRGHYSFTEGDLDDAARCFRVSIESRERQLELDPMDHNARVSLASTCSNLQRILSTAGKPGTSQLAERAASLLEKLYREDPSDAFVICRLANQRVNYAYEQFEAGNSEKAINELTESIEVLERIYVADPTDNDVSNALMSAHGARAELTEALEQFELAVPSWQRVVALVPQGELFWRKNCLLNVLVKAQRIDEAVVTLNELDELDNHKLTGQQYVDIARRAVICLKHDSALRWLKVAKDKASAEEWTRLKKLISEDAVFETLLVQHQSLWLKE